MEEFADDFNVSQKTVERLISSTIDNIRKCEKCLFDEISDFIRLELLDVRRGILARKGKENMSVGGELKEGLSIIDKPLQAHNSQRELAKEEEAIRLYLRAELTQQEVADKIGVSRPQITEIVTNCKNAVSDKSLNFSPFLYNIWKKLITLTISECFVYPFARSHCFRAIVVGDVRALPIVKDHFHCPNTF